jgi:hypothetical protein
MLDNISKVEAARVASSPPEFVDSKGIRALFGLSRAHAYILAGEGKIRSVCIRRRGAIRGKTLFCCQSIRDFFAKCVDDGAGDLN